MPFGAIKSPADPGAGTGQRVSMPFGAIKSWNDHTMPLDAYSVSMPFGAIKSAPIPPACPYISAFQCHLVRLKEVSPGNATFLRKFQCHLVRLKVSWYENIESGLINVSMPFGAIKRMQPKRVIIFLFPFQCHLVRLKVLPLVVSGLSGLRFNAIWCD